VWQISIRRACQALPVDRSTYHYRSKRPGQAILMKRIKEIAETQVRYGYRRIHVLLRREGWLVNAKRVRRLYREMGLQLRNKSPKRRVKAQLREDRSPATAANQVWAMDFVHDQLFDGRKIRILTVVDTFTRLSPAIDVRQHSEVPMSSRRSNGLAERLAFRRRSGSTTGRSSSARSSICGPSCAASRSTSAGPASRPTTPSSKA
jgi:transposase InsO family protein